MYLVNPNNKLFEHFEQIIKGSIHDFCEKI